MQNHKEKYFLLYLRTGGGHLAPASSIAHYLSTVYGITIEPVLVDGLVNANSVVRYILEDGYRLLQARSKLSYEFLYASNKFSLIRHCNVALTSFFHETVSQKAH